MKNTTTRLFIGLMAFFNVFNVFSQASDCSGAINFCGVTMTVPNITGATSIGTINFGCVQNSVANVTWTYFKIGNSGEIKLEVGQQSTSGTNIDVDYALWGPFTSATAGCNAINNSTPPIQSSYTAANIEYPSLGVPGGDSVPCASGMTAYGLTTPPAGQTGEYYILGINNYSNTAGNITLTQINVNTPNAGSLACDNSGCNLNASYTVTTPVCQTTTFTISSYVSDNHYQLDFGDGNVSSANISSISHSYASPGNYTTRLRVWNDTCPDTITTLKNIAVANCSGSTTCALDTNFTFVQLNDSTYSFSPSTITSNNHYNWVFSDGTTSSLVQPNHTFPAHGDYFVTLVVSNCNCSQSKTQQLSIQDTCMLSAGFTYTTNGSGKYIFKPTNLSSQLSYSWDFGDGANSSVSNPNHTYSSAGNYDVILTVSSNYCSVTDTTTLAAVVSNPCSIDANFTYTDLGSGKYTFTPDTTNSAASYSWNFDDGNLSNSTTPTYTFSANGNYYVVLTVSSGNCVIKDTQLVHVTSINPCPLTAHFGYTELGNGKYKFTPDTLNTAFSYSWDFGDGNASNSSSPTYTFSENGDYNVVLTVTSGNCTKKDTVLVHYSNLGLIQNQGNNSINIYPNPFNSYITITNTANIISELTVQLYDMQGALISEHFVSFNEAEHEKKIELPAISTAAYFVKVTDQNGQLLKGQTLVKQ